MFCERGSHRAFFGVLALLFAGSAAMTIVWCEATPGIGEMAMCGWTTSMAWMRTPGQTWLDAAASFLGMWVVMMVAMMLLSLVPMLWRYRQAVGRTGETRLGRLTAVVGVGTCSCGPWSECRLSAGRRAGGSRDAAAGAGTRRSNRGRCGRPDRRRAPVHRVEGTSPCCCREAPGRGRTLADPGTAWRHGLRLGLHCGYRCAGLTAILLAIGVMDLRAMAVVTAAITVERLAPASERVARAIGAVVVGAVLFLIARAAGLG